MLLHHAVLTILTILTTCILTAEAQRPTSSNSSSCQDTFASFFNSTSTPNITHCKKLRALDMDLGWSYYNDSRRQSVTLDIAFTASPPTPDGWIGWGVNPGPKPVMVGTRAIIAFRRLNGVAVAATYNVTRDTKHGCQLEPSGIDVKVEGLRAAFVAETGRLAVAARLRLPTTDYNSSRINHVWQVGSAVAGDVPMKHKMRLMNFDSRETMDFMTGESLRHAKLHLRAVHGVLSVLGWGILMPIGVTVARYFRSFPFVLPRWFIVHVAAQIFAYCLGTSAWGIGLSLVSDSEHHRAFMKHRIIGILIFALATLQIMALWLKPKKLDKYRKYWAIYHHFLGYALLAFSVINIFKGLAILRPQPKWRWAYIAILTSLSSIALALEAATWLKFSWGARRGSSGGELT